MVKKATSSPIIISAVPKVRKINAAFSNSGLPLFCLALFIAEAMTPAKRAISKPATAKMIALSGAG